MVTRIRILVHRWKRVRAQRTPRTRKARIVGPRGPAVRVRRPRIKMMLIGGPQRSVAVLLQFNKCTFRHRCRIGGLVRSWWADMRLPGHGWGAWWILVWSPKRGTQIREVQRREGFVIHFDLNFGDVCGGAVRVDSLTF